MGHGCSRETQAGPTEGPEAARGDLADVVGELTNAGRDDSFMRPLRLAKAGFVVQPSATIGMAAAQKVKAAVIRQVSGRMEHAQLLSVCASIRRFMK